MIQSLREKLYKKGFFHLLSTNFLIQFLGFGSTLAVAKLVTPVELGNIKLLQSYSGIYAVLAGFGLSTALLKFCSEDRSDSEKSDILAATLRKAAVATGLTLLAGALLGFSGLLSTTGNFAGWLLVYSLIVPFTVATNLMITFLQSQKRLHSLAKAQTVIRLQSFAAVVFCTWIWGYAGFVLSTVVSFGLGLIPLVREMKVPGFLTSAGKVPAGFHRISVFTLVSGLVATLAQYADIFILDRFTSDRKELGYYALATVFIMASSQVINTIQQFLSPYFCQKSGNGPWFRHNVIKAQAYTSLFSVALAGAIFAFAWLLIRFVFGTEYAPTLQYLSVLLLRFVIWSAYAITGGVAIFALGRVGLDFIRSLGSMVAGTACSFLLLQKYGVIGAAWGQVCGAAVALIMSVVMAVIVLRQRTGPAGQWTPTLNAGGG